jgi:hypothetical protein
MGKVLDQKILNDLMNEAKYRLHLHTHTHTQDGSLESLTNVHFFLRSLNIFLALMHVSTFIKTG